MPADDPVDELAQRRNRKAAARESSPDQESPVESTDDNDESTPLTRRGRRRDTSRISSSASILPIPRLDAEEKLWRSWHSGSSAKSLSGSNAKSKRPVLTILLIDETGDELGVMSWTDASKIAHDRGLALFLHDTNADIPTARIMDLGRFNYETEKRAREIRRRHSAKATKELKLRLEIAENDYKIKLRSAVEMLQDGETLKVSITISQKDAEHVELAMLMMRRLFHDLEDVATQEQEPAVDGAQVSMILIPIEPEHSI